LVFNGDCQNETDTAKLRNIGVLDAS